MKDSFFTNIKRNYFTVTFYFFIYFALLLFLPNHIFYLILKIAGLVTFLIITAHTYGIHKLFPFLTQKQPQHASTPEESKSSDQDHSNDSSINVEDYFEKYIHNFIITLKSISEADSVFIYLYNEFKNRFKLKQFLSSHKDKLNLEEYIPEESGLFQIIIKNPKPLIEREIELSPKFLPYYLKPISKEGTIIIFPFFYLGKFYGIICLDKMGNNSISQEKIIKIEKIIKNFEIFVNFSSQLFEFQVKSKLEKSYIEISNSFNTSFSSDQIWEITQHFLTKIFSFDRAMIVLTETSHPVEESQAFIHQIIGENAGFSPGYEFSLSDGVVSWSILQRQSIKIMDVYKRNKKLYRFSPNETNQLPTRSLLVSPIVSENLTYGAIVLESQAPYQYGNMEKELLHFLTQQLGHAIRRIMLHERLLVGQSRDPELNIWNTKTLKERIEEELLRSQRFQHPFSVVLFQFEILSAVNDYLDINKKHLMKKIISIIQEESRRIDWMGAVSDMEISLLLFETPLEGAKIFTTRILNVLKQNLVNEELVNIQLKVYASISTYPLIAKSAEEIFATLKQGIQKSKEKGSFTYSISTNE